MRRLPAGPLSVLAFVGPKIDVHTGTKLRSMHEIAPGVKFDTMAREWSCKWTCDGDKASLVACQIALESVIDEIKEVKGVKSVERIIREDCLDFKVVTSLAVDDFNQWKKNKYEPEDFFFEMLGAIDGVSDMSRGTYTKMPVSSTDFIEDED